PHLLLRITLPP
ncbi:hypothetical protein KFL_000230370, partial [Klebsormidium nitens]